MSSTFYQKLQTFSYLHILGKPAWIHLNSQKQIQKLDVSKDTLLMTRKEAKDLQLDPQAGHLDIAELLQAHRLQHID